ncbi:AMP-binding protein [Acidiphilium iwatense]|uniref:AMP-binding protein n=1 Tax=Acidiphilium iwatense TaxID=768198 RepID=A0ABS9DYN4_9PROT|nr:AMP-binding protein [Acidiphilium iwatense]MCF3946796.1 AMP-binding protein [Acidiphilium iwatense]
MTGFAEARDFLLRHRTDYAAAYGGFRWPDEPDFNWAFDWFDKFLAHSPEFRDTQALWIVDAVGEGETKLSFAELSRRSNQAANFLRGLGIGRGNRILLALGNVVPLWEIMLAAMKLGAVVMPATTLLTEAELADRIERGHAGCIVTSADQVAKFAELAANIPKITVGGAAPPGWHAYAPEDEPTEFSPDGVTKADDDLLLYFTSGTTAKPKLVLHSHRSYPAGSLSTMYWIGLQPGDIHLNISSPGWAKHAWSSVFAPWNAGACVFIVNQPRFEPVPLLDTIVRCGVTTLCAPPTVWRHLVQHDLARWKTGLREIACAGEPLNPEIIEHVQAAWGLTIRDGYGQTETTAQIGNTPGQTVKPGAMGRPLPGYRVLLLDRADSASGDGEVALPCGADAPAGLMRGYVDAESGALRGTDGDVYRTGDVAAIDADGYLTFIGRADDVFKSSDYRISPFELESVLIEHPSVAEAAVVPKPDAVRLAVPVAHVALVAGVIPDRETALSIFRHTRARLAPFKRIRELVFVTDLPKTISGKIRRVQLRRAEAEQGVTEDVRFTEAMFPELVADEITKKAALS